MENQKNYDQYAKFKERQLELAGMLGDSAEMISQLSMNQFQEILKKLGEKVYNDTFKIMVVGTFKNGKSTFINSFLGEEILPAYALPTTAVINEVKWGDKKRAVIHFRNPLPEELPMGIPDKAMSHMRKFNMKNIPPLEIPYDEIEDYVVIPFDKDPKEMLLESPYEKVELFWPLPLLENGVEIIDSPGLNEHATRTKVTMDYLSQADAILFVLNAQAICSQEEMRFAENNLKKQGFTDPFFVVNRFDCIRSEKERVAMRKFTEMKLEGYTTNTIYYVSALNALDGKMNSDQELYNSSGMKEFEDTLSEYLTKQKGKAKLSQPARELKRILNDEALFKVIPMQRQMLSTSLDEVKKRYESVQPKLAELKAKKDQIYSRLMLKVEQIKPELRRVSNRNIMEIADCVPAWVSEFTPVNSVGMIPKKDKIEPVIQEISEHVLDCIETYQTDWRNSVLEPIVNDRANDIFGSVEADISKIFSEIDSVNVEIAGKEYETNSVPTWQRIAGGAVGFITGGVGGAFSGGVSGLSVELAKTVALEFGAFFALSLIGLLNPITIIGVLVGVIMRSVIKGEDALMKKLKESITTEIVNQLAGSAEDNSNALAEGIGGKFTEIVDQMVGAVDGEIQETENQVESIINEMEKGKENIKMKEEAISNCENRIKEISTKLDNLIFQLVEE